VSWWEAEAFCRWAGGRRPPVASSAAAARCPRPNAWLCGGPCLVCICNTLEAALGVTSPVGLFPASRQADFGLEDLSGNVWEWCEEKAYGSGRRLRGGSWFNGTWRARAAGRFGSDLDLVYRTNFRGFRVLLSDLRQD
ncbi:MAG: SUMF1/EgtB/PvdO family nonheme iron enzyme, partial [Gammaproteobacteria bacterium]|nr:SUMF1/EgtB/PvdO family nonheme iron enzyme [Gammaproteobacteria bacterium]